MRGHARAAPATIARKGMNRSATRMVRAAPRAAAWPATLTFLLRVIVGAGLVTAAALVVPGIVLDTPQPAPRTSDAIVVISGDEQMARFQEGVSLYQLGLGQYIVFSGAAYDNGTSNADV